MREARELGEGGDVVSWALEAIAVAPREVAMKVEFRGLLAVADERVAGDGPKARPSSGEVL
jgi:hypothetical protein